MRARVRAARAGSVQPWRATAHAARASADLRICGTRTPMAAAPRRWKFNQSPLFLMFLLNEWRDREDFLREDFPVYHLSDLGGAQPPEAFDAHLARFKQHVIDAIQRDEVRERLLHWMMVDSPARAKFKLPELAQLDKHPITPDTLFEIQPTQKVVPYVALNGEIQLLARGNVVELEKVPRPIVDVIVGGTPFTGAQLLAASAGVRWDQVSMLLQRLLFANIIMLKVGD